MATPNILTKATFAAGLCIATMARFPASATELRAIPLYGNWSGGAFSDDKTQKFVGCTASAPYQSGIVMFVSINRGMGWSIGFRSEAWNLQVNSQIPLSISFDGQAPWAGSAVAIDAHMVTVPMVADSRLITLFRAAYQMTVSTSGKIFPFNLDGTSRLMAALGQCVSTQLAIERGDPVPKSLPSAVQNISTLTPVPSQEPQNELFAMRLASNLLLETKMLNAHLLAAADTPSQLRGRGVVWTSDVGVGVVMLFPATTGKDAQQVTTFLISNDASSCKGDFVSGRASELVDDVIVTKSTTLCKDAAGPREHRFFTVPAPDRPDFIVFEVDRDGKDKAAPAQDSPLADTQFQAAAVKATFAK